MRYIMDERRRLLIAALKDENEEVRRSAAGALEKLDIRRRLDSLAHQIESAEMLEKIRVVYALAELKGPTIIELVAKACKDPSEDVRAASARVFGEMRDVRALPHLVEMLKDESAIVARAAVDAIANYNDPGLLGPLMGALKNKDKGVVERAVGLVGRTGDKRAEEAMIHFAVKGNAKMRCRAIEALGGMEV